MTEALKKPSDDAAPPGQHADGSNRRDPAIRLMGLVKFLSVGVVVGSLSAMGYVFLTTVSTPPRTDGIVVKQPLKPAPTPDPAAGWRAFEAPGFRFRYPPYYPDVTLRDIKSLRPLREFEATQTGILIVREAVVSSRTDLLSWVKTNKKAVIYNDTIQTETKEIALSGNQAIFVADANEAAGQNNGREIIVFFRVGNQVYRLQFDIAVADAEAPAHRRDFDLLLNSFAFSPVATPSATPTSLPQAALLVSTVGWTTVSNGQFSIQAPPEAFDAKTSGGSPTFIQLRRRGSVEAGPDFLLADDYKGESRRQWYMDHYSYTAGEVGKSVFFTEKQLGKRNVLAVSLDKSKTVSSILLAEGTKLIEVRVQDQDLALVETMASTLRFE